MTKTKWSCHIYDAATFKQMLLHKVKPYYVYVLLVDRVPFYVGKGSRKVAYECQVRALRHELDADAGKDSEMFSFIRKMKRAGKEIQYALSLHCSSESLALFQEQVDIGKYGRRSGGGLLFNRAIGGQGLHGYRASDETRLKMSAARRGRKQSLAHNRAISEGRKRSEKVRIENLSRKIPVIVEGKVFDSITDASIILNLSKSTIHYRMSAGWQGYNKRNT